jgi:hypothetical protein
MIIRQKKFCVCKQKGDSSLVSKRQGDSSVKVMGQFSGKRWGDAFLEEVMGHSPGKGMGTLLYNAERCCELRSVPYASREMSPI